MCKSVGNVDKAYRVYLELKGARVPVDSHVVGALIATCAEAMKRDLTVVHERKEQFVLLERAFQYVADAEAAGVVLQAPVWNSLMVCAGRSGELNRAFEVLQMMQQRGIPAGATTYGSLIESCVCARQPDKALRVFEVAMAKVREAALKEEGGQSEGGGHKDHPFRGGPGRGGALQHSGSVHSAKWGRVVATADVGMRRRQRRVGPAAYVEGKGAPSMCGIRQ